MQYSPKLKKAMEEMKEILRKHDIAGVVTLHTPGHSEYLLHVTPSYSCATFNGDELRVRARLKEDFHGNIGEQRKKVTDTVNMLDMLSESTAKLAMNLISLSEIVTKKTNAEHLDGGHTSQTTQNN